MVNNFLPVRSDRFCESVLVKVGILLFSLSITSFSASAAPLDILQLSAFLNATELGSSSLQQDQLGSPFFTEIQDAGLSVSFDNQLDASNLGTFSWQIQNTLRSDLNNVTFFAFLDMEIDEPLNSFFNESGALIDVSGTGSGDNLADSWEIDEPGFLFGDIFDNLLAGALDNSNAVPAGLEDDVSLALGFQTGSLLPGETLSASFTISESNIGGLSHTDPDSGLTFYFNGTVDVLPASTSVPEPDSLILFFLSFLFMFRERSSHQQHRPLNT